MPATRLTVRYLAKLAAPRTALVLASGLRTLTQAVIVYGGAVDLGVPLLGAALFSTFSLVIACIVKTRERFMGIGQVLTMPLFFASNAIYPTDIMPPWLKVVAHVNPLSYVVDGLRALMLVGDSSTLCLGMGFGVLIAALAVLVWIGGWMYPRLII